MANNIIDAGEKRINEAVCIDTKRIYDSCVSKDCLEDLRVTFFSRSQRLIDEAVTVKCRECEVASVSVDLEEVPFNRGYYSVDITFYFRLEFDTYSAPCTTPEVAVGYAQFTKKCILYGSDGKGEGVCLKPRFRSNGLPRGTAIHKPGMQGAGG